MRWHEKYSFYNKPEKEDIKDFLGSSAPLWENLTNHIKRNYKAKKEINFSKCSAQPGWNIRYKKGGKSLCTLYPMSGFFIVLIVIGKKEEGKINFALEKDMLSPYLIDLYNETKFSVGGKWLMIRVEDTLVLRDVKTLIDIRAGGA